MFFVEQILVRGLHVLAGSFWVGAAIVMAAFLAPAARQAGPPGAAFMRVLNGRARLPQATAAAAVITIVTGAWLLWRASGGFDAAWFATSYGSTLTLGSLAAVLAFAIMLGVQRPAMQRIARLQAAAESSGDGPGPEMARLQARMTLGGRAGAVLLAFSAVCMAVARYI